MIKSTEEILREMLIYDNSQRLHDKLKEWAKSIIDECAGNFECTMEELPQDPDFNGYLDMDGNEVYPVLVRQTILDVKKQLL